MNFKKILALSLSCAVVFSMSGCSRNKQSEQIGTVAIAVQTATPELGEFSLNSSYIAAIEPQSSVNVMPMISGEVQQIVVKNGDVVAEGDVLMYVDSQVALEQCESADKAVDRALESEQNLLNATYVKAPVSGYVRSIDKDIGVTVAASTQLSYISDSTKLKIEIPFLTQYAQGIFIGDAAVLTMADTGETLNATVTSISGVPEYLDGTSSVHYITMEAENPGGLQAGRTATAQIAGYQSAQSGAFENMGDSSVLSGISGTLDSVYVSTGDYVNAGDLMFSVLSTSAETQLSNAQNTITDAIERRDEAYEALNDYTVKAPASGTVSNILVETYDLLNNSSTVAQIVVQEQKSITFSVTESALKHLAIGQEITADLGESTAKGEISELAQTANTTTGLFSVTALLTSGAQQAYTGTIAELIVADYKMTDALTIPFDSIIFQGDEAYVFTVQDGVAVKTIITVGRFDDQNAVILEGLSTEHVVITSWSAQLRDGALVTVTEG